MVGDREEYKDIHCIVWQCAEGENDQKVYLYLHIWRIVTCYFVWKPYSHHYGEE